MKLGGEEAEGDEFTEREFGEVVWRGFEVGVRERGL